MCAKINNRKTLHQSRVFTLISENITLSNGVTTDLVIIRHPGASAIIPITAGNRVVMIHQYRHAVGGYIWEIPAGTFNAGEAPIVCAKRELIEETGYSAGSWQKLGEIIPVPGYSDERIHMFLADDLMPAVQNLDSDEMLDVHQIRFDDAMDMIRKGEIQDSKTISGLFMARQHLEGKR